MATTRWGSVGGVDRVNWLAIIMLGFWITYVIFTVVFMVSIAADRRRNPTELPWWKHYGKLFVWPMYLAMAVIQMRAEKEGTVEEAS